MAEKVRDYAKLAVDIKDAVGEKNIVSAAHCATRLRLVLKETPSAETTKRISEMPAVIQVVERGGQYQIVIGTHAQDVYQALAADMNLDAAAQPEVKQGVVARVIATMSAVFAPFVYVLAGAGLIQGVLIIVLQFAPQFAETGTYAVLSFISWAPFTFLPILIAITASKHFKVNTFIAVWCCAALLSNDWVALADRIAAGESITFAGLALAETTYNSTVLPPLFVVWILSYVEHFIEKILPDVVKALLTPMICAAIMVPLTLVVIGPLTNAAADGIAVGYNWLVDNVPVIAAAFVGGIWQVFVIFGVHWGVTPMVLANFELFGSDTFQAFQTCAVVAQAAACFGVFFKTRQPKMKNVSFSAGLTGIFGITEPAIYGVTLSLKKPFIYGCVGGAVGAVVVALFGSRYYVYAGLPGLLTTVNAISADNPSSFTGMMVGVLVTVVVTILMVLIFGCDPKDVAEENSILATAGVGGDGTANAGPLQITQSTGADGSRIVQVQDDAATAGNKADVQTIDVEQTHGAKGDVVTIYAPMNGTAKAQEEIGDPTFAEGILGKGAAIVPVDGTLYAPFDCTVFGVADTAHAINLIGPNGIEMLIHIGLDTVELDGKGFKPMVKDGQQVKKGDTLIKFDLDAIKKGYDTITSVLVTNAEDYEIVEQLRKDGSVKVGDPIITVKT